MSAHVEKRFHNILLIRSLAAKQSVNWGFQGMKCFGLPISVPLSSQQ